MDGKGAIQALIEGGARLDGATAVMLGAGGISGVIGYELSQHGVKKLSIVDINKERAAEKADILNQNTSMRTIPLIMSPENLDCAASEASIFIQATPLGMAGYGHSHPYLGFIDRLAPNSTVLDAVINPPETKVIKAAMARGLKAVPGMRMLVGQMVLIFDFMFGVKITENDKDACIQELKTRLAVSK
jgi:shikimate dehydrogenase